MNNEILLILSLFISNFSIILFFKLFNKIGLYVWLVIATILANIEVIILVDAFGMEQTLGNVLFATTFLVTDICSEIYDKKEANKMVNVGIITSFFFILITQFWLFYTPSNNDIAMESIKVIFSNTPRILISSLIAYAISQKIDVWLYHKWWELTSKKCKNREKYLWIRNNGSTLISQAINTLLFTFLAFANIYAYDVLISICISSYVIYIVTTLFDTPFVYIARKLFKESKI